MGEGLSIILASTHVHRIHLHIHNRRSHALERCLEEAVNHMFPVSVFQKHTNCAFIVDEPATYELRVKTVSYFKGIEKTSEEVFGDPIHGQERSL
jgi:hypothetical protein